MTLEQIRSSIQTRKKPLFILLGIILISVALFVFAASVRKEPVEYPLAGINVVDTVSPEGSLMVVNQGNIQYSNAFTIPSEIHKSRAIYRYVPFSLDNKTIDTILAAFPSTVVSDTTGPIGRVVQLKKDDESAIIYVDSNAVEYSNFSKTAVPKFTDTSNDDEMQEIAKQFLERFPITLSQYPKQERTYLQATALEADPTNVKNNADFMQVRYEARIDDVPLITKNGSLYPARLTVWVDASKTVRKARVEFVGKVGENIGTFPLKTTKEIQKDIIDKKVKLINGTFPIGEDITTTVIENASIAYYAYKENLIPIYVLSGATLTELKNSGTGFVFAEAVRP